nr:ATP-grasp domain-containing protein [Pseudohoeflea sp. DP4N28-3]
MQAEDVRDLSPAVRDSLIIQEVCESPEITVDSFHDHVTGHHRSLARERLITKSGVCVAARLYEDDKLSDIAFRIGEALHQRGTICFQTMRSETGPVITDLNLRPGAGTSMDAAAGLDLLAAMVACRTGAPVAPLIAARVPKEGIHITRQYHDHVMP